MGPWGCVTILRHLDCAIENQPSVSRKPKLPPVGAGGRPRAAHLHVVVGHKDGKAAQVAALAGGAVVPGAPGPAARGVPVPSPPLVSLPEGTDQLLLRFSGLHLQARGNGQRG